MRKISRSTNHKNFRLTAIHANRQRIARGADAEEQERMRLVRLNQKLATDAKPVITI
jgi:hypothetical protein